MHVSSLKRTPTVTQTMAPGAGKCRGYTAGFTLVCQKMQMLGKCLYNGEKSKRDTASSVFVFLSTQSPMCLWKLTLRLGNDVPRCSGNTAFQHSVHAYLISQSFSSKVVKEGPCQKRKKNTCDPVPSGGPVAGTVSYRKSSDLSWNQSPLPRKPSGMYVRAWLCTISYSYAN